MIYTLYILQCSDKSLYTGIAKDVSKRLEVHAQGKGSKYVYSRSPFKLVYQEEYPSKSLALQREYDIKQMTREQKLMLIKRKKL
jgi:putative endonuclease